jgi:hypothetical protein
MTGNGILVPIAVLMISFGVPAATAQSYGAMGPARADTRDPNSAPTGGWRQSRFASESDIYARGKRPYRMSRTPVRHRSVARAPAAKPDPAIEAQRNTALFLRDAFNPWMATSSKPARRR